MSSEITKYPPGPTYKMPGKLIRQFIHDPIKLYQPYLKNTEIYLISSSDLNNMCI
jgi:hypothetical protein